MDKQRVQLRIGNATPDTTSIAELADALTAIEDMLIETAGISQDELAHAVVSLVGIEEGSNKLTFSIVPKAVVAMSIITHAINSQDYSRVPRRAHVRIKQMCRSATEKSRSFEFLADEAAHVEYAVLSSQTEIPDPPPPPSTRGTTVIYGRCLRVGGAIPKAEIRLFNNAIVNIDLTEVMAKELARNYLYEEVGIEGDVVWDSDWNIEDFTARIITPYRATDPVAAFRELAHVSQGCWKGVDPIRYVKQIRYGTGITNAPKKAVRQKRMRQRRERHP